MRLVSEATLVSRFESVNEVGPPVADVVNPPEVDDGPVDWYWVVTFFSGLHPERNIRKSVTERIASFTIPRPEPRVNHNEKP